MKRTIISIVLFTGLLIISISYFLYRMPRHQVESLPEGSFAERDPALLPEATPPRLIDIEDGSAVDLRMAPVKKVIDGRTVTMLAYDGSMPGPTYRVRQGAEVTIRLKNDTAAPMTLHAHGIRMDNASDGVPGLTQAPILPGASFEYRLRFPDAGAFWYHPHVRTDYTLESGLYGGIIVTPEDTDYWPEADRDVPIMLDDIALDKNGLLPFNEQTADHALMGRFGNVMLINGESGYRLEAKQGEVLRLYLTNAANTRLFDFSIPGAKMKFIGVDSGRYADEMFVDDVLIAPGERRIVDVLFEQPGTYVLRHDTPGKKYALGQVSVSPNSSISRGAAAFLALRSHADTRQEMESLSAASLARKPDKSLRLSLDMNGSMRRMMERAGGHMSGGHMMDDGTTMPMAGMAMGDGGDVYEWEDTMAGMNAASTTESLTWKLIDEATGKENMDISGWTFKRGDMVKIRLFNDPTSMHPMQHPIHFHGQRFFVLSTNGVKNPRPVWQDTALIAKGDTVDILLEASNPGKWMTHCHILEHAESGMMLVFDVQ